MTEEEEKTKTFKNGELLCVGKPYERNRKLIPRNSTWERVRSNCVRSITDFTVLTTPDANLVLEEMKSRIIKGDKASVFEKGLLAALKAFEKVEEKQKNGKSIYVEREIFREDVTFDFPGKDKYGDPYGRRLIDSKSALVESFFRAIQGKNPCRIDNIFRREVEEK